MIAIVAALPREIAGLVRGVKADRALLARGIHLHRLEEAIVVAAGMGETRAAIAVEAALAAGEVTELISAGLAGACSDALRPGAVCEATVVIDARTGERYETGAAGGTVLVTGTAIAGVREKARLAASYGAGMVDVEAATVARLALAHGLAFRAIKGISDAHDFEMASLARFAGDNGHFRTRAFAVHTALRPHRWGAAMKLGRASTRALRALHEVLGGLVRG